MSESTATTQPMAMQTDKIKSLKIVMQTRVVCAKCGPQQQIDVRPIGMSRDAAEPDRQA
jgi:hypothetical protein